MQTTKFGNLLKEVKTGIIVHGCNDQGVMGSGFAKELRATYPVAYQVYVTEYAKNGGYLKLGTNVIWEVEHNLFIVNAITQNGFGRDGKRYVSYEAIHNCFLDVVRVHEGSNLEIHYPLIGAGLGGGEWSIIQACIESAVPADRIRNLWILDK